MCEEWFACINHCEEWFIRWFAYRAREMAFGENGISITFYTTSPFSPITPIWAYSTSH